MSISAKDLRERFNGIHEIQSVKEAYDGWPEESVEKQRNDALFGVVGDIIIWIEEQEKHLNA